MSVTKSHRIVLIEDNPADHHLFQIAVDASGIQVDILWIKQGEAALEFFESLKQGEIPGPKPGLIFMDLNLPRYRGDEILALLGERGQLPDIPIVVISSSEIQKEREKALSLGAQDFLHKPLEVDQLLKMVAEILRRYLEAESPKV